MKTAQVRIAILGATGYGGMELLRYLRLHPAATVAAVSSEASAGQPLAAAIPHLAGTELILQSAADVVARDDYQVAFCALPNGQAMRLAPALLERGCTVIDLSADFRLKDVGVFSQFYQLEHAAPQLLPQAVYGIPELYREQIAAARLIANPGCFPTSALLALAPLLRAGLIDPQGIIVDSKTGVSGAGRTVKDTMYLLSEANEDVMGYKIGTHRHTPEMEQQLTEAGGSEAVITFVPHLIPMTRGIYTTAYAELRRDFATADLLEIYRQTYAGSPFVHVLDEKTLPHTKWCAGSNRAFLTARVDPRTHRVTTLSVIDNLGKGMAGQAVQNMNIIHGFPETDGLDCTAVYP